MPRHDPRPTPETIAREHAELRQALATLADASETLASSDPDMPSHRSTERAFDDALHTARTVLAATNHDAPPPRD